MDYSRLDPLISISGEKITTVKEWETFRREEIMVLLSNFIYGVRPMECPPDQKFSVDKITEGYMGFPIVRKDVTVSFNGFSMEFYIFLPQDKYKKKSVCGFLHILNHSSMLKHDPVNHPDCSFLPIVEITRRGYACIVLPTRNVMPDFVYGQGYKRGIVHAVQPDVSLRDHRSWTIISGWAYGASRVLDYLETDCDVDYLHICVAGHSRAGKAALWAAATDTRFAMAISNDSGSTGAAYARGKSGERIKDVNQTKWFCGNYQKYNDREEMLPCDQHLLLAAIAPRPLYVKSNVEDSWADPEAELKSCRLASPVYELYGLPGFVMEDDVVEINKPYHKGTIAYHRAPGGHDLNADDWSKYLDFVDKYWGPTGRWKPYFYK